MIKGISTAGIAQKNDKYFIALRKPGTSIGEVWEFPGGKAEANEDPQRALEREYLEEFNVKIKVNSLFFKGSFSNKGKDYQLLAFFIELLSEDFTHPEHQDYKWASLKEIDSLPMADSDKSIIEFLKNNS